MVIPKKQNPCAEMEATAPGVSPKGYPTVALIRDGGRVHIYVHRLVLDAFVGPRPPGLQCRHLDGNPANNALSNLVWGSPVENQADRKRHGTANVGEAHPMAKLSDAEAGEIWRLAQARKRKEPGSLRYAQIAARYGVTKNMVWMIANGHRRKESASDD